MRRLTAGKGKSKRPFKSCLCGHWQRQNVFVPALYKLAGFMLFSMLVMRLGKVLLYTSAMHEEKIKKRSRDSSFLMQDFESSNRKDAVAKNVSMGNCRY